DAFTATEDTTLPKSPARSILANDTHVAGTTVSILVQSTTAHGTLDVAADGTFSYIPQPNFNGLDQFTYKLNDGTSASNVATVTITVNPVNDPPVATGDSATTSQNTPVTIAVLANDTDADGNALSIFDWTSPLNGGLVRNPNQTFTYTPNANF